MPSLSQPELLRHAEALLFQRTNPQIAALVRANGTAEDAVRVVERIMDEVCLVGEGLPPLPFRWLQAKGRRWHAWWQAHYQKPRPPGRYPPAAAARGRAQSLAVRQKKAADRARVAWDLHQGGLPPAKIAQRCGVSVRQVYRYIERQARTVGAAWQQAQLERALAVTFGPESPSPNSLGTQSGKPNGTVCHVGCRNDPPSSFSNPSSRRKPMPSKSSVTWYSPPPPDPAPVVPPPKPKPAPPPPRRRPFRSPFPDDLLDALRPDEVAWIQQNEERPRGMSRGDFKQMLGLLEQRVRRRVAIEQDRPPQTHPH